jgi:multiple sugar transport system substrate-binding protein
MVAMKSNDNSQIMATDSQTTPPVTRQIIQKLEKKILSRELKDGDRLYSVRKIAEAYGVSVAVGLAAYRALEKKGLVVREAGRGTFVQHRPKRKKQGIQIYSWNGIFPLDSIQTLLAELAEQQQMEKYEFHPFYTAGYGNYNEYIQWLQTANTNNQTKPDLIAVDEGLLPIMAERNLLLPLNDLIERSSELSVKDFPEKLLRGMTYKGKIYSLPITYSPTVLFYNRDIFTAENLPEPDSEWDWGKFYDMTKLLTKTTDSGQIARYGLGVVFSINAFAPFIFQGGGEIIDRNGSCAIDTDEAAKGLNFFSRLYNLPGVCSHKFGEPRRSLADLLSNGLLAMLLGDAKDYQVLKDTMPDKQWGMVRIPGNNNNHTTSTAIQGWSIGASSVNPEDTFKLMQQLYHEDNLHRFSQFSGFLPAFQPENFNVPLLMREVVKDSMFSLSSSSINAFREVHSTITTALSHRICLTREKCLEFQKKINIAL